MVGFPCCPLMARSCKHFFFQIVIFFFFSMQVRISSSPVKASFQYIGTLNHEVGFIFIFWIVLSAAEYLFPSLRCSHCRPLFHCIVCVFCISRHIYGMFFQRFFHFTQNSIGRVYSDSYFVVSLLSASYHSCQSLRIQLVPCCDFDLMVLFTKP